MFLSDGTVISISLQVELLLLLLLLLLLYKNLHKGDTPERRRMQISVSPKTLEHEYPNEYQGLC